MQLESVYILFLENLENSTGVFLYILIFFEMSVSLIHCSSKLTPSYGLIKYTNTGDISVMDQYQLMYLKL